MGTISFPRRIALTGVLVGAAMSLAGAAMAAPTSAPSSRPTTAPTGEERVTRMLAGLHGALGKLGEMVGGLSAEQQAGVDSLEKFVIDKVKADPTIIDRDNFKDTILLQYRKMLTADQQTKFDAAMGQQRERSGAVATSASLKQIAMGIILYGNENNGAMPPDLGALVAEDLVWGTFVVAGSPTKAPADFATMDPKKQAAWVNENTDFVYLGTGKNVRTIPPLSVVAFIKPSVGFKGNIFVRGDGAVVVVNVPETAEQILNELKAGKNPPPSLQDK